MIHMFDPFTNAATAPRSGVPIPRRFALAGMLALVPLVASGCSGSESADVIVGGGTQDNGSSFFFGETNSGGQATSIRVVSTQFGRLVELSGLDGNGGEVDMGSDFVIGQAIESDGFNYELTQNPVTGQERLTILRNVNDPTERGQFLDLARGAGNALDPIQVQGLDAAGVFSMLPRNAALVVTFDDLLDVSTIDRRTIEIVQGYPPTTPFEARVFPSQYFGGSFNGQFAPTRIVYDLTTSEIEAFNTGTGDLLNINGQGLAASLNVTEANTQLRIPTRVNAAIGVTQVLSNLTDHQLATSNNGPVDFGMSTRPVTRAMRSGGRPGVVIDDFNGFLLDEQAPQVVGATPIDIPIAPEQIGDDRNGRLFDLPEIAFLSELCTSTPQPGHIIVQSGVFAEIVVGDVPPTDAGEGVFRNLRARLLLFPQTWVDANDWERFGVNPASYETGFSVTDIDRPECFVQITPTPEGFPENPTQDAFTSSSLSLRFSEPMDSTSLTAFDSVTLTRNPLPDFGQLPTSDFVVGRLSQTSSLRGITFVPDQLLAHADNGTEEYFLTLADFESAFPPRDLAGNVVESLPQISLQLKQDQPRQFTGGRVSRFSSIDEEEPEGAELGGQVLIDTARQLLRPRPVIRSQVIIDNEEQPLMAQMTPFAQGVVTPFSQFGSKMQTIWRYADCGFALTDSQNINLDVESLSWAPAAGTITPDAFDEFEIRLAHSRWAPDEVIDPGSLFPRFPQSGLRPNYEANLLPFDGITQQTVHDRTRGYTMDQGDLFTTGNGTTLMPFPLNRGIDEEDFRFFTWRDTSIRARGGGGGAAVEPQSYQLALGQMPVLPPYYSAGQVQTIGLPLLMEFRTFPDPEAIGLNAWSLNLAVNSSSRPYFRAFSTGGVNQSGSNVFVDPGSESSSAGGFNPGSVPPGAGTFGRDNSVHLGAIDYVTRISRSHSIWFEALIGVDGAAALGQRTYAPPVTEPGDDEQPAGTSVDIDFRGAVAIQLIADNGFDDNDGDVSGEPGFEIVDYRQDAFLLDLYGDYYNDREGDLVHNSNRANPGLSFLTGPGDVDAWRDSVSDITNARFYQVRLTFVGNAATGQSAEVSALALTWQQPD